MSIYEDHCNFLKAIFNQHFQLGLKIDLSNKPELFNRPLNVIGLYIYGRAFSEISKKLSSLNLEIILYNKTILTEIISPEGYHVFRIRDLQEFPYCAAVRIQPPDKNSKPRFSTDR